MLIRALVLWDIKRMGVSKKKKKMGDSLWSNRFEKPWVYSFPTDLFPTGLCQSLYNTNVHVYSPKAYVICSISQSILPYARYLYGMYIYNSVPQNHTLGTVGPDLPTNPFLITHPIDKIKWLSSYVLSIWQSETVRG